MAGSQNYYNEWKKGRKEYSQIKRKIHSGKEDPRRKGKKFFPWVFFSLDEMQEDLHLAEKDIDDFMAKQQGRDGESTSLRTEEEHITAKTINTLKRNTYLKWKIGEWLETIMVNVEDKDQGG